MSRILDKLKDTHLGGRLQLPYGAYITLQKKYLYGLSRKKRAYKIYRKNIISHWFLGVGS